MKYSAYHNYSMHKNLIMFLLEKTPTKYFDKNGYNICFGDTVKVPVLRASECKKIRNKNHGLFYLNGIVVPENIGTKNYEPQIMFWSEDVSKLTNPIRPEIFSQHLFYAEELSWKEVEITNNKTELLSRQNNFEDTLDFIEI